MSPSGKRRVLLAAQVIVTVLAVAYVLRMIRFEDTLVIARSGTKPLTEPRSRAASIDRGPERTTIVWTDGTRTEHASRDVAVRDGFLKLFARTNKTLYAAMFVAMLVPYLLLAARWGLLLRGYGFRERFGRVFFVTYAGAFFNHVLPGSVGGDLTKALIASAGENRKAAVAATVVLDRLLGLGVMVVLGAVCLTPFLDRFADRRIAWLIYGMLAAMVGGYTFYLSPPFRAIVSRLPFRKTVAELDEVFRSAWRKKGMVAGGVAMSLGAQASSILIIYGMAIAMGIQGVGLWMFFIFEPIIFIITALPISVGGLGVQEAAYEELFGRFGGVDPNQAVALSILHKLSQILISIPGGILFGLGATRKNAPPAGTFAPQPPGSL